MSTVEILRAAKALIPDEDHWSADASKHVEGYGRAGTYCMAGAIYAVVNGYAGPPDVAGPITDETPSTVAAIKALAAAIGVTAPVDGRYELDVTLFNDDHDRTHAEILAAFDRAIAQASA